MIGVVPTTSKSFEVEGDFESKDLKEGKLYYDKSDGRLYFYSTTETRSNPNTGYFPVWDGKKKYKSKFSNEKYFEKDALKLDLQTLSNSVNGTVAQDILYRQRRCTNDEILAPSLSDGDNMFTQCIKGVINKLQVTMVDLIDMGTPKLSEKIITSYYSALTKITFMRMDKWFIWLDQILHIGYEMEVFKDDKKLLSYSYPEDIFDTGIVKYSKIIETNDDSFKKIVKILMIMENITKDSLRSDNVDDYTINNMMTTLSGNKPLSSQLFSRFIRMAKLTYIIRMLDKDKNILFEFKE